MRATHTQFIGIYEDAVDGGLCDVIINEFNRYSDLGLTAAGVTGVGEATQIKKSEDINLLSFPSWHTYTQELSDALLACYKIYGQTYVGVKDYTAPHILTALQLQKYSNDQRGAYYQFHCEVNPTTCDRVTTFIIYLNDIAEGGETEFLEQKLRIKPRKGTIAIFPAYFTHVHRGNPVLSDEDKYIATGWYNFA